MENGKFVYPGGEVTSQAIIQDYENLYKESIKNPEQFSYSSRIERKSLGQEVGDLSTLED